MFNGIMILAEYEMIMKKMCFFRKLIHKIVQRKRVPVKRKRGSACCRVHVQPELLLAEGLAVGALIHGRIALVGAHQNPVQRTVVLVLAVVCALMDGAFDALVGIAVHGIRLLFLISSLV